MTTRARGRAQLFHIDFGHAYGNFMKWKGIKRERAPFVFTPDFAFVMGGRDSNTFHRFVATCGKAYNILRHNAHLFINLFAMMLSTGMPELQAQVSQLHPVLLDRKLPLWKFHVFDGLAPGPEGGKRVAVYSQLHHAAVDGQAAVALAQAILDLGPQPRTIEARATRRRKGQLGTTAMLRGALAHQLEQLGSLVKALPAAVGALSQVTARSAGGRCTVVDW